MRSWDAQLEGVAQSKLVDEDGQPLEPPGVVVQRELRRLRARAGRRAEHLSSFNVVLFGRTGTGKSSFVEALSRGDGCRISTKGLLDHTRDVQVRTWRGFSIVDTPGIQGWEESNERKRIERLAHEAVERADVVFLAFDSLNQKIGEFKQVGQWVTDAGKAAVALLNVKDGSWRFDEQLLPGDPRTLAVSQVRGHAEHVMRMLVDFGLPDVPVIALNTQWAVAARSPKLKAHPALEELEEAIDLVGRDRLEHIANVRAVTDLLQAAVQTDPETLRLGGVRTEVAAVLNRFVLGLTPQQKALVAERQVREKQLTDGMDKTGCDPVPTKKRFPKAADRRLMQEFSEVLARLWSADDKRVRRRDSASLKIKLERALDPPLAKLRNDSLGRAQKLIGEAFTGKRALTGDDIVREALTEQQLRTVLDEAVASAFADLGDDLLQDAEDAKLDLEVKLGGLEQGFDAGAGSGARQQARAGGLLAAGALSIGLWTGGLGLIAAGVVGGLFARRRRKQAELKLREERTRVERRVSSWLDGVLREARTDALVAAQDAAVVVGARTLLPLAREIAGLTEQRRALHQVADEAAARRDGLTTGSRPQDVISAAKQAVETQRHPGDADATAKVWLGEDWLDEPVATATVQPVPLVLQPAGTGLVLPPADVNAVTAWLETCAERGPQGLRASVDNARTLLAAEPQVVLIGDYSAGKTSLIRRVGAELGLAETDRLPVGAGPTTMSVVRIDAPAYTIVDTPGLESERVEDEETARAAVADGALLVVVHSAASGDLTKVLDVVRPPHLPERAMRVVHILGRIDALASRPHRNGPAFVRLLEVKRDELRGRLREKGLPCPADLPLPVAGDPGGRNQNTAVWARASFDLTRGWDGVESMLRVLERLARDGRPAAAVDRAVTDLAAERERVASHADDLEASAKQVQSLVRLYRRAQRDHQRIEKHAEAYLRAVVGDLIAERTERLADAAVSELERVQADPQQWFLTHELNERLNAWTEEIDRQVALVYADLDQAVRARTRKPAFAVATERVPAGDPLRQALEEARASGAKVMPVLVREGVKRLPKLAAHVTKLGPVAGKALGAVAGVVLEGVLQKLDDRAAQAHAEKLQATIEALRAAGERWVSDVVAGMDGTPGVLDRLVAERRKQIDGPLADRDALVKQTRARIAQAREECAKIEALMAEGRALLAQ